MDTLSTYATTFNILRGFSWDHLSIVVRSKLIKSTMLIPILGYIILYNESFINIVNNFRIYGDSHENYNPIIRIHILYISLTCLAIASVIVTIFCPKICQNYSSADDYSSYMWDKISINQFVVRLMRVKHQRQKQNPTLDPSHKGPKIFSQAVDEDIFVLEKTINDFAKKKLKHQSGGSVDLWRAFGDITRFQKEHRDKIIRILDWEYIYTASSGRTSRIISAVFYAMGFIGLIYISLEAFFQILGIAVPEVIQHFFG